MNTVASAPSRPPRPTAFTRPVFVVAAPGVDTAPLVAALAATADLWVLDSPAGDVFAGAERLQPGNRGWDSSRLGRQDAKPSVLAEVEQVWRSHLRRPDGTTAAPETGGLRIVASYDDIALHLPFLSAAWPDARFVHVERDAAACRADMEAAWAAGTAITYPHLPEWDGLPWSLALTPEWRKLRGAALPEVVAAQHAMADRILREDLASLVPGRWTGVAHDALVTDLPGEVQRLLGFLDGAAATRPEEAPSPFRSVSTTTFVELLDKLDSSLLATTYQTGRLVMARPLDGRLNTHFRELTSPMGIAYRPGLLSIGTKGRVQTFADLPGLAAGLTPDARHDACFVPRSTHFTGDIRVHDVAWAGDQLWAVATRFSCLVTLDGRHSFVPRWSPPFISELAPEDRCHLNGLAVVDDRVKYVTALGTTDVENGWRERKADGGMIMDVETDEIVAGGLSMPHSPRWYRDQLWVLESGQGSLARVDLATGRLQTVAQLPGFTRGLAFAGRYAFVGLSEVREAQTFGGLPLTARLENRECGIWVVDIVTGQTVGFLRFEDFVQEIFDVALLPGIRFPELVDEASESHLNAFMLPQAAFSAGAPA